MTPEQRRHTAFEAFDAELGEGATIDQAITAAAEESGLRAEVVGEIVRRAFGDLASHQAQIKLRHENALEHGRFQQKLSEYVDTYHVRIPEDRIPPAAEWVAQQLGRSLTPEEERVASERHVAALNLSMSRDLDAILKDLDRA